MNLIYVIVFICLQFIVIILFYINVQFLVIDEKNLVMRLFCLLLLGVLCVFYVVVCYCSFKQVVEVFGVSVMVVSYQIKLLELVLECWVCECSVQGVSLIVDGEIFYVVI